MTNEVLTTAQTAELLGISVNCLRQWKARKPEKLVEGQHWISDAGQVLWTTTGLEQLQLIKGGGEGITEDVIPTPQPLQQELEHDPLLRYNPLVESVASGITGNLLNRIDQRVTQNLKVAIATPMSSAECVTVLSELGLKPPNLELLLSTKNQQLLSESEE